MHNIQLNSLFYYYYFLIKKSKMLFHPKEINIRGVIEYKGPVAPSKKEAEHTAATHVLVMLKEI
jgi:hypothetical protein